MERRALLRRLAGAVAALAVAPKPAPTEETVPLEDLTMTLTIPAAGRGTPYAALVAPTFAITLD
jgi:hypothetical protein